MNADKTKPIRVYGSNEESKQINIYDKMSYNGVIEPFFSFQKMLMSYYANVYHRLCINAKARILSTIDESDLAKYIPKPMTPARFLLNVIRDLELYGNAFVEVAGSERYRALYYMPSNTARVDKEHNVYQMNGYNTTKIEAKHLSYDSPSSKFYGEPEFLAALTQIALNQNIDLYNDTFFENGAVPRLVISFEGSEPDDEQLEAFEAFFKSSFQGVKKAHKSLILSAPITSEGVKPSVRVEELGQSRDMSFERLKSIGRDEIVAAHNVPPRLVGVVNGGGWGGQGEFVAQMNAFNEMSIKPKQVMIEEFFGDVLGIKLTLKPLDTTTFKDDTELIGSLVDRQIITIAEARNMIGWQKNLVQNQQQ